MYWYISFLRPPPISVPITNGSITITPQVANDLQTEQRYEPTEINYSWQRAHPSRNALTEGARLTTYQPPSSTYTALQIPLPEDAKIGEKYRLHLFPHHVVLDMHSLSGEEPPIMGVYSDEMELVRGENISVGRVRGIGKGEEQGKGKGKGKTKGKGKEVLVSPKQTRIERHWELRDGGALNIVEQTASDLDKKIWDSGVGLSSWLWRHVYSEEAHNHPTSEGILASLRGDGHGLRILELGSGTGLVSIALALVMKARRSMTCHTGVYLTATDLGPAISLMGENITRNGLTCDSDEHDAAKSRVTVDAKVLDWDQPLPEWLDSDDRPDLIVAADVTYNTSAFPSLVKTIESLLKPPTGKTSKRPKLLLAYKERDPAERSFWDMLKEKGIEMLMIDQLRGATGEGQVEIWVGRVVSGGGGDRLART